MKYFIIGVYPPPFGGVSVYVYRYTKILKTQGYDVENIDFSKETKIDKVLKLLKLFFWPNRAIFHLNDFNFYVITVLILRVFGSKLIFTDHSYRKLEHLGIVKRLLLHIFLIKVSEFILVGEHLKDYYVQFGYRLPRRTMVHHAFFPPPVEEEQTIWKNYDEDTIKFVQTHKPLIIANAFQIVFYEGVDLYGLDMCVELIAELKKTYLSIGLLFALAEIGDQAYFSNITRRISELGINDNFHFMTGQKELWPLFRISDLMVRPTYTDGYGISIAEALYFGCPAVASDVCIRPEGTVLFRNRDISDLSCTVNKLLKEINK
jgi:glycosyltransferase involved in cell wall biosynthesis